MDGIDSYVAGNADLNFMFDRYMSTKTELRVSTRANYLEIYERYVRSELGRKKIGEIKYSDILFFYNHLITEKNLHIGTIQYLQRLIRPSLEMAVRDNIIRINPANGILMEKVGIKRYNVLLYGSCRKVCLVKMKTVIIGSLILIWQRKWYRY